MTNWCKGRLRISGDPQQLGKFVKHAETKTDDEAQVLDADKFIPRPRIDGEVYVNDVWCMKHWGIGSGIWDASLVAHYSELGAAEYSFKTMHNHCGKLVLVMSERFPGLLFIYDCVDIDYCWEGCLVCKGGKVLHDVYEEFDFYATLEDTGRTAGDVCNAALTETQSL